MGRSDYSKQNLFAMFIPAPDYCFKKKKIVENCAPALQYGGHSRLKCCRSSCGSYEWTLKILKTEWADMDRNDKIKVTQENNQNLISCIVSPVMYIVTNSTSLKSG